MLPEPWGPGPSRPLSNAEGFCAILSQILTKQSLCCHPHVEAGEWQGQSSRWLVGLAEGRAVNKSALSHCSVRYPAELKAAACHYCAPLSLRSSSDDEAARKEALQIIRDLKKNNEAKRAGWTIEVTDCDRKVWQIHFMASG